jgi:hypothetical protein
MVRLRALALLPLLAAGCGTLSAELRRPPPPPPPPGLVTETADPLMATVEAAAAAFADRGAGLAGRPAAAAQAIAQLEYIALSLGTDQRYPQLAGNVGRELLLARDELRNALGIMPAAPASAVMRVMLAVAADLRAGRGAAAAAAMQPPLIVPGGAEAVARLGELGQLVQASNATAFAREAVARAEALGTGGSTGMVESGLAFGQRTGSFEGAISSVGY